MKALWILALSVLAGFAAVYVSIGRPDNAFEPTATAEPTPAAATSGSDGTKMAAFVKKSTPLSLPDITFKDADGKDVSLSSFKGKTVLLNLWATWCAPCREEMPALNRLQQALGSDKFEVVALSLDRQGVAATKKFLDEVKADALKLYIDSTAKQGLELKIVGMPTTILIDAEGKEIGRLAGPAEWDSADAKSLIKSAIR